MATIYLHVFSGRPDPFRVVGGSAADELLARIQAVRQSVSIERPFSLLGFRGVEVELTNEEAAQSGLPLHFWIANGRSEEEEEAIVLAVEISRRYFELDITDLLHDFRRAVAAHRAKNVEAPEPPVAAPAPSLTLSPIDAPYNPEKYNGNPTVLASNNCYAYACDMPTNTFPQPGRKHGYRLNKNDSGETVRKFATIDGLLPATAATANGGPLYYVALVFAPKIRDYHWYRQVGNTKSGYLTFWAHKPGQLMVTNRDNSGEVITSPLTCNRGEYTEFIGYMYVPQSFVQIV